MSRQHEGERRPLTIEAGSGFQYAKISQFQPGSASHNDCTCFIVAELMSRISTEQDWCPIFDGSLTDDVASSSTWQTPSNPQIRLRSFVALKVPHKTHPWGVTKTAFHLALCGSLARRTVTHTVLQIWTGARCCLSICTTPEAILSVGFAISKNRCC